MPHLLSEIQRLTHHPITMKSMSMSRMAILRTMFLFSACIGIGFACGDDSSLKEVFRHHFMIGGALNDELVSGKDPQAAALVERHFNSITPENVMKWEHLQPEPGKFTFEAADRVVEFGVKRGMFIVGHTLIWHHQTPSWVFQDSNGKPVDRKTLLKRMKDHISTVVGRYRGKVRGWDVVNEALNEDGSMRQSSWMMVIGEDYVATAFAYAHEADPSAELYYNDFSLENEPKRHGALRLVKDLQARKIRIDGVGTQGHYKLDWPSPAQVEQTIEAFAGLGLGVMITELDVDVLPYDIETGAEISMRTEFRAELNPYPTSLPPDKEQELARRYADLFRVFVKHADKISRVTFWGVYDGRSWLNDWPVRGRTNHPLLFDRSYRPKPAFFAVVQTARKIH